MPIKRWSAKDGVGQEMVSVAKDLVVVGAKTSCPVLEEPTGLVLRAPGKPSPNVPFMMRKRVAETSASEQVKDFTGPGSCVFDAPVVDLAGGSV